METNQCGCSSRCLLKDFAIRYSLPESRHAELQLVTIQTYYGIFCKGQLRYSFTYLHCMYTMYDGRMYESQCGELVWENDEYEGHDITLLAPPTSQHWVGIYGNSGVWLLCSHRLSEHTQLLSQALFPVTTNADEVMSHYSLSHSHLHLADYSWRLPRGGLGDGCFSLYVVGSTTTSHKMCSGGSTFFSTGSDQPLHCLVT